MMTNNSECYLLAVLLYAVSCSSSIKELSPASEEKGAAHVAIEESRKKGWGDVEVTTISFDGIHWIVTVWWLPKTPGGFATYFVTTNGILDRVLYGK